LPSIEQVQQELIEEFDIFDDWMARYEYVIDLGKQLPDFPDEWRTEDNRIKGCQSQVWLNMQKQGDVIKIDGTSDAAIVSGLVAVVLRVYSNRTQPRSNRNSDPS